MEIYIRPVDFKSLSWSSKDRSKRYLSVRENRSLKVSVLFRDASKSAIGTPFSIDLGDAVHMEAVENGAYTRKLTPVGVHLDDIPDTASSVLLSLGGHNHNIDIGQVRVARPRPPDHVVPLGNSESLFHVDVISERFAELSEFKKCLYELYNHWNANHLPFTDPAINGKWGLRGLFWRADKEVGNFNTPDSKMDGRRLFGDNEAVSSFLEKVTGRAADVVLVCINSHERGGAGGVLYNGRMTPAWTTRSSLPGENWCDIALHELGHAIELYDEYDTEGVQLTTDGDGINVSRQDSCARTPWHSLCGTDLRNRVLADDRPVSIHKGARYNPDDWYRPAKDCLMRSPNARFCPVCADHLARRILDLYE